MVKAELLRTLAYLRKGKKMRDFFGTFKGKLALAATAATVAATQASASIDTTDVTFATDDATTVAGLVLVGVGVMWGIRKAISVGNRG